MRLPIRLRIICLTGLVLCCASSVIAVDDQKRPAKVVEEFTTAFKASEPADFFSAAMRLEQVLYGPDGAAGAARDLLARKSEFVTQQLVVSLLDSIVDDEKAVVAAQLLVQIARGEFTARRFEGSGVVVGQLVVEDDKVDPTLVLAQMPILEEGYFAGEFGDFAKPICFRSHGYEDLDVMLSQVRSVEDDVVYVGRVTLKPLESKRLGSLCGKIALDAASTAETAVVTLNVAVGPVNTPTGGFSPRPRWPEGLRVPVSETGEFTVKGLNPSGYSLIVSAEGHVNFFKKVTMAPGEEADAGTCRLYSSDLGFYIGASPPETADLAWETDYQTALQRANREQRPLLIMMTATWCGPCKELEEKTLNDPWIRHFLSPFVLLKAYEDEAVEKIYGMKGYPMLVFADRSGKQCHHCIGYMPAFRFAAECAKAYRALSQGLPSELQSLIEKQIIVLD